MVLGSSNLVAGLVTWPAMYENCSRSKGQRSRSKRHILGMSTSPWNDSRHPKMCRLNCTLVISTPTQNSASKGSFLGLAKQLCRNSEISHRWTLRDTDSWLLFQTWSNRCRICVPKAMLYWWQKKNKTRFGAVWQNPWRQFPHFFVRGALWSNTQFHPNPFQFGGVVMEKPFCDPPKWF